jgi:tetratricopeptide (TPR) repeat protein
VNAALRTAEQALGLAIGAANARQPARARQLCLDALALHPSHPALLHLLAVLWLQEGRLADAARCIEASLRQQPGQGPAHLVAGDVARAAGDLDAAVLHHVRACDLLPGRADAAFALAGSLRAAGRAADSVVVLERAAAIAPGRADVWFELGLVRQDLRDYEGAAEALRVVLQLAPRAEVEVNLGIVLQEAGRLDEAMRAYWRAYRLREETFGRIAHALATARTGCLWLDLDQLRSRLQAAPA